MSDGTVPVNEEDAATSDTPVNAIKAGDFPTYLYAVYSFGEKSGYGYRVLETFDLPTAEKHAQMYRGVVARQQVIVDYRKNEQKPCTNCKNIAGGWCTECRP